MRANAILLTILLAAATGATACSPYDPDLGEAPFRCGTSEPLCPDGYSCEPGGGSPTGVCVASGESVVDGGVDASGADAGPFVCNNDSAVEPNDDISSATLTMIPDSQDTFTLVGLAICPDGDVDVYRFRVDETGKNVLAEARETNRSRGELVLELLSDTGVVIATGEYTDNATLRVTLDNAAADTYYVQVRGQAASVQNNYNRIYIETTGP